MNICPICGFSGLIEPAYHIFDTGMFEGSYEICPSCGFETGKDEFDQALCEIKKYGDECHLKMIKGYRKEWIEKGMQWWSKDMKYHPKPENWDPSEQLKNIPEGFR